MEGKYHEISKGDLVHSFNGYVQDAPYGPGPSGGGGHRSSERNPQALAHHPVGTQHGVADCVRTRQEGRKDSAVTLWVTQRDSTLGRLGKCLLTQREKKIDADHSQRELYQARHGTS